MENKIRLLNVAADIIPLEDILILGASYEDRNLSALEEAEYTFEWIDQLAPGEFVFLMTGGAVFPHGCTHESCMWYDPIYHCCLVPTEIWDKYKHEALHIEQMYRQQYSECSEVQRARAILSAAGIGL